MDIGIRKNGEVIILEFSGSVTRTNCDEMRDVFRKAADDGGRRFVFDFTPTTFMDSAAIGETVACLKRVQNDKGGLRLVVARDGKVHKLLQLVSLHTVFEVFFDESEALEGA